MDRFVFYFCNFWWLKQKKKKNFFFSEIKISCFYSLLKLKKKIAREENKNNNL